MSIANLMYFKIPHTKIRIGILFIFFAAAVLYADFSCFTVMVLSSAAIHELGHIAAMKAFGVNIYSLDILPFGAVIHSDSSILSYKRECAVALAGIFANLFACVGALAANMLCRDIYSAFFCICNLFLAAVNLFPIRSLDGGRALEAILNLRIPHENVERVTDVVSFLFSILLCIAALAVIIATKCNFSLLIFCVYIIIGLYAKSS